MSSRWQVLIPAGRRGPSGDLPRLTEDSGAPYADLPYADASGRGGSGRPGWSAAMPFVLPLLGFGALAAGLTFELPIVAIVLGLVAAATSVALVRAGSALVRRRGTLLGGACGWLGVALGVAALVFAGGEASDEVPLVTDDYRVTLGECRLDGQFATQEGEFTNLTAAELAQVIEVSFTDADGEYVSGDTTIVQAVPEQTVPWEASGALDGEGRCAVTAILPFETSP